MEKRLMWLGSCQIGQVCGEPPWNTNRLGKKGNRTHGTDPFKSN